MTDSTVSYRLHINGVKKRSISEASRGTPISEETKKRISETRLKNGSARGSKNPNWRGGIQTDWEKLKNSNEYKLWRKAVYERDNYTCRACNSTKKRLEAHHILPRCNFKHLTFAIDNGITLCLDCHKKTYFKEYDFVAYFEKLVNSGKPTADMVLSYGNPEPSPNAGEGVETRHGSRK